MQEKIYRNEWSTVIDKIMSKVKMRKQNLSMA